MKTLITTILFCCLFNVRGMAQLPTIAVAPIKTYGISHNPEIASKLTRLELIKISKYNVLDEFDMMEIENPDDYSECFGRDCLLEYGHKLNVDYMISGKIDALGSKIIINLKLIDMKIGDISRNHSIEFNNNEDEVQRMLGITIQEMHDIIPDEEVKKRLVYNNDPIIASNLGQVSNVGPRIGVGYTFGTLHEFMTRSESQGGLGIQPIVTNIGYQFELQYVGTENFSGLFEFVPMLTGLEQGQFIPSMLFLNGYRFGRAGWEVAFGPNFGLTRNGKGFFDTNGAYGTVGKYWDESEFRNEGYSTSSLSEHGYEIDTHMDSRGKLGISTKWIISAGRTFRSGALNVPVNVFYSSQKGGGMLGLSVGFNITRSRKKM